MPEASRRVGLSSTFPHLRSCGFCDSSKNKHATKHFHKSGHPIIQSFEPGETWGWCYVDQLMLDFSEVAP